MKKKRTRGGRVAERHSASAARNMVRATRADLAHLEDRTDWARVEALTDADIARAVADDPDAAPILDEAFWRNARLLESGHGKTTITMRVDADVLAFFKRRGAGYQSRMNAVLRAYAYAPRRGA